MTINIQALRRRIEQQLVNLTEPEPVPSGYLHMVSIEALRHPDDPVGGVLAFLYHLFTMAPQEAGALVSQKLHETPPPAAVEFGQTIALPLVQAESLDDAATIHFMASVIVRAREYAGVPLDGWISRIIDIPRPNLTREQMHRRFQAGLQEAASGLAMTRKGDGWSYDLDVLYGVSLYMLGRLDTGSTDSEIGDDHDCSAVGAGTVESVLGKWDEYQAGMSLDKILQVPDRVLAQFIEAVKPETDLRRLAANVVFSEGFCEIHFLQRAFSLWIRGQALLDAITRSHGQAWFGRTSSQKILEVAADMPICGDVIRPRIDLDQMRDLILLRTQAKGKA